MAGILTPTVVTREAARLFYNNLVLTKGVNRQYDNAFEIGGAKAGDTTNMRLPQRYTVTSGTTLGTQSQDEYSRPLQLSYQKHVPVRFTSKELTLSLQDFSDRVLAPAMAQLANEVDSDLLEVMRIRTSNVVGTPGSVPNALLTYLQAGAYMSDEATPRDAFRSMILDPNSMATIVDALKGLFQQSEEIGQQYMQGLMGRTAGFKWGEDQNVRSHTVGPLGGTPQVAGANQGILTGWAEYTDVTTSGWTASAAVRLNQGDIITFGGVQAVNPINRSSVGRLRTFVVESTTGGNISSDGTGAATVRDRPAIIAGGQYQNVTARPANLAPITVLGTAGATGRRNMAYHRDAFVVAFADLEMPDGVDWKARISIPELGFSIRAVRQYSIDTDTFPCRMEVLYGIGPLLPECACAIAS